MTLQEAHEIQRRELISLRAENKRLQKQVSGLFSSEEREALERHIRHLEQVNRTEASRYEAAREQWKLTDRRCFDLEVEILELKDQVASLTEENESLRSRAEKAEAEVRLLNGTNKKLERKLNTNFKNSSLAQVGLARPQYIPQILSSLCSADLSKYNDSMRPLIERDMKETEKILINSNLSTCSRERSSI